MGAPITECKHTARVMPCRRSHCTLYIHTGWCMQFGLSSCPSFIPTPGCYTQANVSLLECITIYTRSLKLFGACLHAATHTTAHWDLLVLFKSPWWVPLLRFIATPPLFFLAVPKLKKPPKTSQIESTADEALVNSGSIHGKSLSYVADDRLAAG